MSTDRLGNILSFQAGATAKGRRGVTLPLGALVDRRIEWRGGRGGRKHLHVSRPKGLGGDRSVGRSVGQSLGRLLGRSGRGCWLTQPATLHIQESKKSMIKQSGPDCQSGGRHDYFQIAPIPLIAVDVVISVAGTIPGDARQEA